MTFEEWVEKTAEGDYPIQWVREWIIARDTWAAAAQAERERLIADLLNSADVLERREASPDYDHPAGSAAVRQAADWLWEVKPS